MNGLHLIADLYECACPPAALTSQAFLQSHCRNACEKYGLTVVAEVFHRFSATDGEQSGVTGAIVLAESHLALHTWPEIRGVTLDLYVCNFSADNSAKARALFTELIESFVPGKACRQEINRG